MTISDRNASPEKAQPPQIPAWAIVSGMALAVLLAGGVVYLFVWGSSHKARSLRAKLLDV